MIVIDEVSNGFWDEAKFYNSFTPEMIEKNAVCFGNSIWMRYDKGRDKFVIDDSYF